MSAEIKCSPGKGETSSYTARWSMTTPDLPWGRGGLRVLDPPHEDSTANNSGKVTQSLLRGPGLYFLVSLCV